LTDNQQVTRDLLKEQIVHLSVRVAELESGNDIRAGRIRRLPLAAFSIVLAVAVGGVAFASVPDSTGVIHGCYSSGTPHSLQVIDTAKVSGCPSGTIALKWNQTGPRGPQGLQGPTGPQGLSGPQGIQGPAGTSNAAYTFNPNIYTMDGSGLWKIVDYANVPAGHYVVNATATAAPQDDYGVECRINNGSYSTTTSAGSQSAVAVADQVYLAGQGEILFECRSPDWNTSSAVYASSLSAVKVDSVAFVTVPCYSSCYYASAPGPVAHDANGGAPTRHFLHAGQLVRYTGQAARTAGTTR
jgi:hypothetical protein